MLGRRLLTRLACTAGLLFVLSPGAFAQNPAKQRLVASIDASSSDLWQAALQIWEWAEPGYQETHSAALLAEMLEARGFEVKRGVAGIPTAFVATYGSGSPVLGILAEYDALPGLSQTTEPTREVREETSWGHGCGHHLFGVGSVAAAMAIADAMERGDVTGTLRLFGSPAEEGGSAKVFLVREGLFDDADAVLHWHPMDANSAGDPTNMARIAAKFRFKGRSAHAAAAPEQGRSALDAVELMNHAAQLLREHTPDFTRIHHVITNGGGAPNVVPDFAEVFYYARHPEAPIARSVYDRLVLCAQGAALATETELEIEYLGGTHNIMPNDTLARVTLENLAQLNDLRYDETESSFARELQKTLDAPMPLDSIEEVADLSGAPPPGSTDVGDVSWVVPTTGLSTACWVPGTPAHSWQAVSAGGMSIGRKGMLLAAQTLAATAFDLFLSPETLESAREELERRLGDHQYTPMLEEGQPPPLDYRN